MMMTRWLKPIVLLFWSSVLFSCQLLPPSTPLPSSSAPEFDKAVHQLAQELFTQLQAQQNPLEHFVQKTLIAYDPFVDVNSGQVVHTSLMIESGLTAQAQQFPTLKLQRMTPATLKQADYLLNGILERQLTASEQLSYQITASIIGLKTQTVVAQHQVGFLSAADLNYQPTPSYADNPIYIRNQHLKELKAIVNSKVGSPVAAHFYQLMTTKALLVEAQTAYDQGDYQRARALFEQIVQQPEGQVMEVYAGLYMANFKLGDLAAAEDNFARMVALGIERGHLPVKLLFESRLTKFLNNPELKQQYELWIKQLALYFQKHPNICVNIVGHSSRYGENAFNQRLSQKRAQRIQKEMSQFFPAIINRSHTLGKGSQETIVGTTPDSAENAIDRRVEFHIVDCAS